MNSPLCQRGRAKQADAGVFQHVAEGIHPAVASAIRNGKRRVVEAMDEAGTISLRRQIDHPERIARTDHHKLAITSSRANHAARNEENTVVLLYLRFGSYWVSPTRG